MCKCKCNSKFDQSFIYSPNDAQVSYLKNNIKIYIKTVLM